MRLQIKPTKKKVDEVSKSGCTGHCAPSWPAQNRRESESRSVGPFDANVPASQSDTLDLYSDSSLTSHCPVGGSEVVSLSFDVVKEFTPDTSTAVGQKIQRKFGVKAGRMLCIPTKASAAARSCLQV